MDDLATYLQRRFDAERAAVANELHDVLGGLLAAAKVHLALLERALLDPVASARTHLNTVKESLNKALTLERKLVEQLYPSLLVHAGLNATLRWHVEEVCAAVGRPCAINVPTEELPLPPGTSIALYRVVEDALRRVLALTIASPIELEVRVQRRVLTIGIAGKGTIAEKAHNTSEADYALVAMHQRVESIGGRFKRELQQRDGIAFTIELDLDSQGDLLQGNGGGDPPPL